MIHTHRSFHRVGLVKNVCIYESLHNRDHSKRTTSVAYPRGGQLGNRPSIFFWDDNNCPMPENLTTHAHSKTQAMRFHALPLDEIYSLDHIKWFKKINWLSFSWNQWTQWWRFNCIFSSKYSLLHLNSLVKNLDEYLMTFLSTCNHIERKRLK